MQKISYAKSKSKILAKLDGQFNISKPAAAVVMTAAQQVVFDAPIPGSAAADAPSGLLTKPPTNAEEARGQKRPREEDEEDEDSDVAMEEDSDDD